MGVFCNVFRQCQEMSDILFYFVEQEQGASNVWWECRSDCHAHLFSKGIENIQIVVCKFPSQLQGYHNMLAKALT